MLRFFAFVLSLSVIVQSFHYAVQHQGWEGLVFLDEEKALLLLMFTTLMSLVVLLLSLVGKKEKAYDKEEMPEEKKKEKKKEKQGKQDSFQIVQENEFGRVKVEKAVIVRAIQSLLNPKKELEQYTVELEKTDDQTLEVTILATPDTKKEFSLVEFTTNTQEEIKEKMHQFMLVDVHSIVFEYRGE